jgi:hypothetical protein
MRSLLMQDEFGQIEEAHSISAGLDYPGIGPEHAYLAESGRAEYYAIGDEDVIPALRLLSEMEGIIPALETAHAVAWMAREAGHANPHGLDRVAESLRSRRQGRGPSASDFARRAVKTSRSATFALCATPVAKLLVPYFMAGVTPDWTESRPSGSTRWSRRRRDWHSLSRIP